MTLIAHPPARWLRATLLPLLLLVPGALFAQGILVRPMSAELSAKPGQTIDFPLEVSNNLTNQAVTVDVKLCYLSQNEGGWAGSPPEETSSEVKAKFSSMVPWSTLDKSTLDLPALGKGTAMLHVTVPASARGFYGAALTVMTRPAGSSGNGVNVLIRFLIPVLLQVDGSVPTRKITLGSPVVRYGQSASPGSGALTVGVQVKNAGQGMNRVGGKVKLMAQVGSHWLPVATGDTAVRRVIPGADTMVQFNVDRRIPSGRYRVEAALTADGQPLPRYTQEVDVQGDPHASAISPEAALLIEPGSVEIEGTSGAFRTATVTLRNGSEGPVSVRLRAELPKALEGVMMGELRGDQMDAAKWITVSPETFTLAANNTQRVRVSMKVPDGLSLPFYYANLSAALLHGQEAAGTANILVTVKNQAVTPNMLVQPQAPISLSKDASGAYSALATFGNAGTAHVTPTVRFVLTDTSKITRYAQFDVTNDAGLLLPLSVGRYSAQIETKPLKPGVYALTARCEYGGKVAESTVAIEVKEAKGVKTLSVVIAKPAGKTPAKSGSKGGGK